MEVSYNVRYKKQNFSNRVLVDKEGEIVIFDKGFSLKGKGASDKGVNLSFGDVKEFYHRKERIYIITFTKEKYIVSDVGSMFENLLKDIYKARNNYLIDGLFMRNGNLVAEFEGSFQRISKFGKPINKDKGKLRFYEKSLVIIPAQQDAFVIHFNFVNFYEFNEIEYTMKIVLESGLQIVLSQLGNDFELFQEKMNEVLGGMYATIVNDQLRKIFPYFGSDTLLKLAYKMKGGKAVSRNEILEMDKELAKSVEEYIFENPDYAEKLNYLKEMCDDYQIYYGIAKDPAVEDKYIKWSMFALTDKNLVAFSVYPRWKDENGKYATTYFFKIIMEKGVPADKVEDKAQEINQALVNLNFVKDPCYKDKRELKNSPYQYAIRKLPYLRILRKSYLGRANKENLEEWKAQAESIFQKAKLKERI